MGDHVSHKVNHSRDNPNVVGMAWRTRAGDCGIRFHALRVREFLSHCSAVKEGLVLPMLVCELETTAVLRGFAASQSHS